MVDGKTVLIPVQLIQKPNPWLAPRWLLALSASMQLTFAGWPGETQFPTSRWGGLTGSTWKK